MDITKFDEVILTHNINMYVYMFNLYQEVWLVITVGGAAIAVCITNT